MNFVVESTLAKCLKELRWILLNDGYEHTSKRWQGKEDPPPFMEILHASLIGPMYATKEEASTALGANQPWADKHFDERVSGLPLNPPPSHVEWNRGTEAYLMDEKFSHSYPERMWSKGLHKGIRFEIADLSTAIELLKADPETRQCYIPIWFPEDLSAALKGERVPCTFGWHFMLRDKKLHCSYHMRSCDAVRHVHNDLYFANRLAIYLIEQTGMDAVPGELHFSSTSFHCFKNDAYPLGKLCK